MWAKLVTTLGPMLTGMDKGSAFVHFCRAIYSAFGVTVSLAWYTGWRNQRIAEGDDTIPIPGVGSLQKRFSAARGDAPLPAGASPSSAPGGGAPGGSSVPQQATSKHKLVPASGVPGAVIAYSAPNADKQHAMYDPTAYGVRLGFMQSLAARYNNKVTSGYRSAAQDRAQGRNYHSFHEDGLAFDAVGRMEDMRRLTLYAVSRPDLFQEVFLHQEGSGLHVHVAFWPDVKPSSMTSSIQHRHPNAGRHLG